MNQINIKLLSSLIIPPCLVLLSGCTPRVEVAPPEKPITINLNVKIDHEVRVKVEKDVDQLLQNEELF